MIDVIKEIVMILTGCLTALGGWELVRYLLNRKSNERKADAEAEVAEATAERMKFENFQKAFEFSQEQLRLKEERFAELLNDYREAIRQNIEYERRIGELLAERSLKLCEVKKCGSREPFSGY